MNDWLPDKCQSSHSFYTYLAEQLVQNYCESNIVGSVDAVIPGVCSFVNAE